MAFLTKSSSQKTEGNRVRRTNNSLPRLSLQARLRLSKPGDAFEQEADNMAKRVINTPTHDVVQRQDQEEEESVQAQMKKEEQAETLQPKLISPYISRFATATVSRQEAESEEETVQTQMEEESEETVQPQMEEQAETLQPKLISPQISRFATATVSRQEAEPEEETVQPQMEEESEETLQPKLISPYISRFAIPTVSRQEAESEEETVQAKEEEQSHVPEKVAVDIQNNMNSGYQMPLSLRRFMETRFQADFSKIKIHTDDQAAKFNQQLNAQAFTLGNHIFFGKDKFKPDSQEGKELIAHELTHTVQQGAAVQTKPIKVAHHTSNSTIQRLSISSIIESVANKVPGYSLIKLILGKSPITGEEVPRTGINIIKAVLGLIPVFGDLWFQQLQKTGAINEAGVWLDKELIALNITWAGIKALIAEAKEKISIFNSLSTNLKIVKDVFNPTWQRIQRFVVNVGGKIKEFIFRGALKLVGAPVEQVMGILNKGADVLQRIIDDPIGFFRNLARAVGGGINKFVTNIQKHLVSGLIQWLTGALSDLPIQLPAKFDLKGILDLILQILGLTWQSIRAKLVKRVGEKPVAIAEKSVEIIQKLVTEGPIALWNMLKEKAAEIKEQVMEGIRNWTITRVVQQAVIKLLSFLNPAGALVQAVLGLYNLVMFFYENATRIVEFVQSVFNSIGEIATGAISKAATFIEQAMGRTVPIILGFLARLIGLSGIGKVVSNIIGKIRKPIDKVVGKAIDFMVKQIKKLFTKAKKVAKKVKDKLVTWWKQRKTFKHGGKTHTLFFEGKGPKAKLMMRSDKQALEDYYEKINKTSQQKQRETPPPSPQIGQAIIDFKLNLDEYNRLKREGLRHQLGTPVYFQWNKDFGKELARLSEKITEALAKIPGDYGDPNLAEKGVKARPQSTKIKYPDKQGTPAWNNSNLDPKALSLVRGQDFGQLRSNSIDGKVAEIEYLSFDLGSNHGSKGEAKSALMRAMKLFRGVAVVPGHLINHHLGGPGDKNENIAPITGSCNTKMSQQFEEHAKKMVLKKNQVIHYRVVVKWGNHSPLTNTYKIDLLMPTKVTGYIWIRKFRGEEDPNYDFTNVEADKKNVANWIEKTGTYVDPKDSEIRNLIGIEVENDTYNALPGDPTVNETYKKIILEIVSQAKTRSDLATTTGIDRDILGYRLDELIRLGLVEEKGKAVVPEGEAARGGRGQESKWRITTDGEKEIIEDEETLIMKILKELRNGVQTPSGLASELQEKKDSITSKLRTYRKRGWVTDQPTGATLYKATDAGIKSIT